MNPTALHQRCWNHEGREAVCRCPECGRSFCRECVAEHEMRFLCAACLKATGHGQPVASKKNRFGYAGLALGGILLAWIILFCAGETVMTFSGRLEQTTWQSR
jgi:hypothetical protein